MLAHPITQELLAVSQFWNSLNGEIYVLTRVEKVVRKETAETATKKAEEAKSRPSGKNGHVT